MSDSARPPTDDRCEHDADAVADDGMAPLIDNTGADDDDPEAPSG